MKIILDLEADVSLEEALAALLNDRDAALGALRNIDEKDVSVELVSSDEGLGFDETTLVTLAISFGVGVASGVVANYVFDSLGKSIRRINVNKNRVRPNREDLTRALDLIKQHIDDGP